MTACPHPGKRRYATIAAATAYADGRQIGLGVMLAPYACPCGWVHLTSQQAPTGDADPGIVNRLRHVRRGEFEAVVEADAAGHLPLAERTALRHPRLYGRWVRALAALGDRLDAQIANAPPGSEWRARAQVYRGVIRQRLDEAAELHTRRSA